MPTDEQAIRDLFAAWKQATLDQDIHSPAGLRRRRSAPDPRRLIVQEVLCAALVSTIAACGVRGVPLQLQRQQIEIGSATISVLAPVPWGENTYEIPPDQRSF